MTDNQSSTTKPFLISREGSLGRAEFAALGTGVVVLTTDPGRIAAAVVEVRSELAAIDSCCSRFRTDSELEVVNRSSGHTVAVSPLLAEAIACALHAAAATEGLVDPTVGAAMDAMGYDREFAQVRAGTSEPPAAPQPAGRWKEARLNRRWGTLHLPRGARLDLGATAKALAAERSARRVHQRVGCGVLVSLGGDIAIAGEAPPQGWTIRITDWHGAALSAPGESVSISSGGLATSSTMVRRWIRGDSEMHHIVDPATGRPATVVWRTVTVHAGNCVDANAAATAAIIKGEQSVAWLESVGLAGRLVRPDGTVTRVAGWPVAGRAA